MEKRDFGRILLTAMILLLSIGSIGASSLKTRSLEQKIYEISVLRAKMMDKIDLAVEIRTRLEQRFAELRDEIRAEQTRIVIHSRQQALQNLRIRHNLDLIRVILAYTNRLNQRIDYFQTGNERLRFMVDQINDDIAIINTLEDMEIENFISRIDRLLDEFTLEAKKRLFEATDIQLEPIDHIWNEIDMNSAEGEPDADQANISRLK
jgi:hypothetical protein